MALHACFNEADDRGIFPIHKVFEVAPEFLVVAASVVPKEYPHFGFIYYT